jgi:NADPH:quinone reductase-like Zn-dependent oxidoreductase
MLEGIDLPRTGQNASVGTLVTKSLLIVGEGELTVDENGVRRAMLRAYHKATGTEVGAVALPAPQSGSPMTYMLKGEQYIVLAEAAAIPLVALTAWQALFQVAKLQKDQTILIHAGAGGVGSIAVQLAKWRGAHIIATASDYNHNFLRELGVDVPVDYRTQNFEDFASDVDVVLDPIGGDTQIRSLQILKEGGILVSIVGLTSEGRNPSRNVRATSILVRPN